MRGLTILVATGDAERLHTALGFAAATAATGARIRLHLHEGAVALLAAPLSAPNDPARHKAGLPKLGELWEEALGLGVAISLCQSGLALHDLDLEKLDPRLEAQGPVSVMTGLGDDRLVAF
ncbi:DsrE family protein [Rhizorhabdus dicambivorans]|nr:DsrE family protein [Rhizorhabdus dicambivorans]